MPGPRVWRRIALLFITAALTACAGVERNVGRSPSQAWAAPEQTRLGQLVIERRQQDHARSTSGFLLLDHVDAAYAARVALIQAAQRTLDLQYYAIHADATTELLLEELRRAARRGVRIRVLVDDFNAVGKDAQVLRLAVERNVEVRLFNPMSGARGSLLGHIAGSMFDKGRIAKRMHNKLFLADNAMGIAGGRNLGDAYFGADDTSNFIDIDVLAAGAIVRDMSASFDRFWNDELAYPVAALVGPGELEKLRRPAPAQEDASRPPATATAAASEPVPVDAGMVLPGMERADVARQGRRIFDLGNLHITWAPSALLADAPGKVGPDEDEVDAGDTVVDGLLHLVDAAQHEVLIVSPYFVPGLVMTERLRQLGQRGVRVRVLTNSLASNDAPAAHAGYARYRMALLQAGVELYELRAAEGGPPGSAGSNLGLGSAGGGSKSGASRASLHSKGAMIDGRIAVIGSMNLDLRSQTKNSEVALVIRSGAFTRAAMTTVQTILDRSSYRVLARGTRLVWQAPPGARFEDASSEPGASTAQKFLAGAVAPFAPDEML